MSLSTQETKTAEKVVRDAMKAGQADIISKKMLVDRISEKLSLAPDHFSKQQKNELAAIAKRVLDEPLDDGHSSSSAKPKPKPPQMKAKAEKDDDSSSDEDKPEKKLSAEKATLDKPKAVKSDPVKRKSKAVVSDSDEEDVSMQEDKPQPMSRSTSVESDKPAKKAAPAKKRKSDAGKGKKYRTAEFLNSEGDPIDAKPKSIDDSDDEAVEQPKKKRSKKSEDKPKAKDKANEKKPRAPKKAAELLDSDEEELKKLKSFVVACGERKMWSKEFAKHDLTTVKSQIKWLKQLLNDLGMPSRMSLGAAKEVGAKRALEKEARELGIDVGGAGIDEAPRAKRAAAQRKAPPPQQLKLSSDDESGSDGTVKQDNDDEDSDDGESDEAGDGGRDKKPKKKNKKASAAYEEESDDVADEDGDGQQSSSDFHDSD